MILEEMKDIYVKNEYLIHVTTLFPRLRKYRYNISKLQESGDS